MRQHKRNISILFDFLCSFLFKEMHFCSIFTFLRILVLVHSIYINANTIVSIIPENRNTSHTLTMYVLVLVHCTGYSYNSRGEWYTKFLLFSTIDTLLPIKNILMSSIKKNRQISTRARTTHERQSFYFQKITGT